MFNTIFRDVFLPYYLQRMPDGKYVVVNRNHKPVGFRTDSHIEYDEFPVAVKFLGLGPETAKKLSVHNDPNLSRIYLHDGAKKAPAYGGEALEAYIKRLRILMDLKIEVKYPEPGLRKYGGFLEDPHWSEEASSASDEAEGTPEHNHQ